MRTPTYDQLIASMPSGLEKAVIQVLRFHVGKEKAIKKPEIMSALARIGHRLDERQFREAVHNLRNDGWLIASFSSSGYFLVSTQAEYTEFRESELTARITDLSTTRSRLDAAARQQFGEAVQVGLL